MVEATAPPKYFFFGKQRKMLSGILSIFSPSGGRSEEKTARDMDTSTNEEISKVQNPISPTETHEVESAGKEETLTIGNLLEFYVGV